MTEITSQTELGKDQDETGNIRLSVVVPSYNSADTLALCLDSLVTQDFDHDQYEVVIIDDGSTDNTREVVSTYLDKSPTVRLYSQPNRGPASARNCGARYARGEIIVFTDADCVPAQNWLTEMQRPFADTADPIVAVKGAYRTRQESVIARFAQIEFETRYRKMQGSEYVDFVDTYAAAFTREVFLATGGFDTSFPVANNEDVEFSYRLAALGHKMVFNPDAIVYHQHPDTVYRYLKQKFGRAYWRVAVYNKFPDKATSDSYTPQVLKFQIAIIPFFVASLVYSYLTGKYGLLPAVLLGMFLLSALPFLASIVACSALDKAVAWLKQCLKGDFVRRLVAGVWRRVLRSAPVRALKCVARLVARLLRALRSMLRKIAASKAVLLCMRGLRKICVLIIDAVTLTFRGLWYLLCLPGRLAVAGGRLLVRIWRFMLGLPVARKIVSGLNRIASTKVIMLALSFVMLFLRGVVMALGVLWGMRAHGSKRERFSTTLLLVLADCLAVCTAIYAAYYTKRFFLASVAVSHLSISSYLQYAPFLVFFLLTVFYLGGLYRPYKGLSRINEFAILTESVMAAVLVAVVLMFCTKAYLSRIVVFLLFPYILVMVSLTRWLVRTAVERSQGEDALSKTHALVVGTGEIAQLICKRLRDMAAIETVIVGLIDKDPRNIGKIVSGIQIIGCFDDLGAVIDSQEINDVFVALPVTPQEEVMELVNANMERAGVHFHVVSSLFDLISAEIDIAEHSNIPIAYLRNENMEFVQVFVKRVFDLVVSAIVIMVTFPFWLVIMVAIKLETDGPAMFRQERVGKNGKQFDIYKFRTMFSDTPAFEYSPAAPTDKRITRVGGFLRKTSLDEFPQFLNVVKGEMSLVGPRPEMPFIVEKYRSWERQRLTVKPGLTGLWQIMGRKDLPLHESLEYDFYYIKNQSLLLDLTILIKTIPIVLGCKGAY